jgi:hypothetical protein
VEPPVCSGLISRTGYEKRGRGRTKLDMRGACERGLKDWTIVKELPLDRRVEASNLCQNVDL